MPTVSGAARPGATSTTQGGGLLIAPLTSTANATRTMANAPRLMRWDEVCHGDRADVAVDLPPVLEKTHGVNCGGPLFVSDQAFELQHRLLRRQGADLGRATRPASDDCPLFGMNCAVNAIASTPPWSGTFASGRLKIRAVRRAQRKRTTSTPPYALAPSKAAGTFFGDTSRPPSAGLKRKGGRSRL
jgi:hypothetical protein